jgi:hypothetical protein
MTKYNVSPLVAREIEFSTGTIFGGSWCRYFISITLHQYYDYSPSQVEAILFGVPQLTPEHQDYIITGLKKHLREFIQDEEQDDDMISQYTNIYNAIEKWESDKRETQLFDSLAASELIRQLNK